MAGKEDPRVELIRAGLHLLPEDNPVRRKLVEKLRLGGAASDRVPNTTVRQWLELVADISVRELLDLLQELDRAGAPQLDHRPLPPKDVS